MSEGRNSGELDRAIEESLKRQFAPPQREEWAKMAPEGSALPPRRAKRKVWIAFAAAAALCLLLLRIVPDWTEANEGDLALADAWLERWEEMSTSPSELEACTVVAEAPTGLLSAARGQWGLHLESDALLAAFAPADRVQNLDRTQGVQLVVGDHAYLFFAQTNAESPQPSRIEAAGLRLTMRDFGEMRIYELAGETAPELLETLRVIGRDSR